MGAVKDRLKDGDIIVVSEWALWVGLGNLVGGCVKLSVVVNCFQQCLNGFIRRVWWDGEWENG